MRYTVEHEGRFYIVENVPARVDEETGEQYFAPATVERLQQTILDERKPSRSLWRLFDPRGVRDLLLRWHRLAVRVGIARLRFGQDLPP